MAHAGLGHFLGLDVHDVDGSGNPIPKTLQPGHVVTCEPGIYFVESILGPAMLDGKKVSRARAACRYYLNAVPHAKKSSSTR